MDTAQTTWPGQCVSGFARITDDRGRLLVLDTGDGWVLPGGAGLPGESAADALAYHVRRALRVHVTPGTQLVVEYAPSEPEKVTYLIDCGLLPAARARTIRLPLTTGAATPEYVAYDFTAEPSARLRPSHRRLLDTAATVCPT
ncbi:NUDIX hydrolase [Streptomyces griseocarneus]|nr:NUDIX hydrolase [Streptomyces griseocarneus]